VQRRHLLEDRGEVVVPILGERAGQPPAQAPPARLLPELAQSDAHPQPGAKPAAPRWDLDSLPEAGLVQRAEGQGAKDAGKWRLEGKDYVVQDGDVIHFRFNV
jgi:hypothetical protein